MHFGLKKDQIDHFWPFSHTFLLTNYCNDLPANLEKGFSHANCVPKLNIVVKSKFLIYFVIYFCCLQSTTKYSNELNIYEEKFYWIPWLLKYQQLRNFSISKDAMIEQVSKLKTFTPLFPHFLFLNRFLIKPVWPIRQFDGNLSGKFSHKECRKPNLKIVLSK